MGQGRHLRRRRKGHLEWTNIRSRRQCRWGQLQLPEVEVQKGGLEDRDTQADVVFDAKYFWHGSVGSRYIVQRGTVFYSVSIDVIVFNYQDTGSRALSSSLARNSTNAACTS